MADLFHGSETHLEDLNRGHESENKTTPLKLDLDRRPRGGAGLRLQRCNSDPAVMACIKMTKLRKGDVDTHEK